MAKKWWEDDPVDENAQDWWKGDAVAKGGAGNAVEARTGMPLEQRGLPKEVPVPARPDVPQMQPGGAPVSPSLIDLVQQRIAADRPNLPGPPPGMVPPAPQQPVAPQGPSLVDLLQQRRVQEQPNLPGPQPGQPAPSDVAQQPSQPLSDIARRGARGLTQIPAAAPEVAAVLADSVAEAQVRSLTQGLEARARDIREIEARISQGNLSDKEEAFLTRHADRLRQGRAEIQKRIDAAQGRADRPIEETDLFKAGDKVRAASLELFGTPDPEFDDRFVGKLAEAGGNFAGIVGLTVLTGGVAGPAAGLVAGGATGASMGASEMFRRAREGGADEETAKTAALLGAIVDATEVVPIGRALNMLPSSIRERAAKAVGQRVSNAFTSGGEEAAQEAAAGIAKNLVEQGLWNPERGAWEDVGEDALIGGILGGGLGAIAPTRRSTEQEQPQEQQQEQNAGDAGEGQPGPASQPRPVEEAAGGSALRGAAGEQDLTEGGRFEVFDETEMTDEGQKPTGRKVRVNMETGDMDIVDPRENAPDAPQPDIPEFSPRAPQIGGEPQPDPTPTAPAPIDAPPPREDIPARPAPGPQPQPPAPVAPPAPSTPVTPDAVPSEGLPAAGPIPQEAPQSEPRAARAPEPQQPDAPARGEVRLPPPDDSGRPGPLRATLNHEETLAVETDPDLFQFKGGGDAEGVTERLQGVNRFDPIRAGQVMLYERADGTRVVADGHQRTGLARRKAAEGQQDVGGMTAIVYREADGYSPEDVRTLAALKNIGEGSGTAVDAARVLRDEAASAQEMGLPPRSALVRDAEGIRRLSDEAFAMVANGRASERDAGVVGRVVENKAAQASVLEVVSNAQPANAAQAEIMARDAAATAVEQTQDSLFGSETLTVPLLKERAQIVDSAVKAIRKNRAAFNTVIEQADALEGAGNRLDQDANSRQRQEDDTILQFLQTQSNRKGPISDALNEAARQLATGDATLARARKSFTEAVQRVVDEAGPRSSARPQDGSEPTDGAGAGGVEVGPEPAPAEAEAPASGVTTEPTEAGEQGVLPGAEQDAARSDSARQSGQRAEMEARQQQSRMGTTEPQDGPGGLFDTQGDLLDQGRAEQGVDDPEVWNGRIAPDGSEMRAAITAARDKHSKPDDKDPAQFYNDLSDTPEAGALMRDLAQADGVEARKTIADEWVMERGKATGNEHAVMLDADGVPVAILSGDGSNVAFPNYLSRALVAGDVAYGTHNHPSNSGFSVNDVMILAHGLGEISAVGHAGAVVEGARGPAMPDPVKAADMSVAEKTKTDDVYNALLAANEIVRQHIQGVLDTGQVTVEQAQAGHAHIFSLALDRLGVIDLRGNSRDIAEKEGLDVESIIDAVSNRVANRLRRAGFDVTARRDRGRNQADRGRGETSGRAGSDGRNQTERPSQDAQDGDGGGRVSARAEQGQGVGSRPGLRQDDSAFTDQFPANFIADLAANDDLFAYPRARSRSLEGVFGEIVPEAKYEGQMSPGEITADAPDVERHVFKMPNGEPFFVYRTDDEVWFDVSRLEEGGAGNALYAAMGDYAFNSGRVFIGDPEGLSEIALRRRTEAMLSTAFKHGTTEHIAPHEYQVRGDESLGVPPLRWRDGDHLANMQTLIDVSVESLAHHVPEFRRARYDFDTGTFRNAQGAPITDGNLREWSSKFGRVRAARAGVRTLKRNILFNTLSRTSSGQRPGLLEQALRQPGKLVGESLIGAFAETEAQFTAAEDRALFFSPAVRFVEGAKQKQATARDWKAILGKAPGVDIAELKQIGVNEWLDAQDGQISREALSEFLRDGYAALSQGSAGVKQQALSGWHRQVFDLLRGKTPEQETLSLGRVPEVLKSLGARGQNLVIQGSKLRKVIAKHTDLPANALIDLPAMLSNPVVLVRDKGDERQADMLAITDAENRDGDVVVAALKRQGRDGAGQSATVVITVYSKSDVQRLVNAAQERGNVLYVRGEREGTGYRHTGANSLNASLSDTFNSLRADRRIRTPRTIFKSGKPPSQATEQRPGYEANPRIGYAPGSTAVTPQAARAMLPKLRAELDRMNLGRVGVKLGQMKKDRQGAFVFDGFGVMDILIENSANPEHTLYHESIHAMYRLDLFTEAEWDTLSRDARAEWIAKHDIDARYPHLTIGEKVEEAIAEEFAERATSKTPPEDGAIRRAFSKIYRLLKAIRAAIAGKSSSDIFGDALAGRIGARDAGSTGVMLTLNQGVGLSEGGPRLTGPTKAQAKAKAKETPRDTTFRGDTIENLNALNAKYGPGVNPVQLDFPKSFEMPERRGIDKVREEFQDQFVMFEAAEKAIEASAGAKVPEAISFRLKQNLFNGRTASRLEGIARDEVNVLVEAMRAEGIGQDDLGRYLLAKHAPERNALMAKRNPEKFGKDGGSGLYNGAAKEIMDDFKARGMLPKLERLEKMTRAMIDRDLKLRRDAGLISQEQYDSYRSMYQHYVPLRGAAERDEGGQIGRFGKGFDIRGKEVKAALGRMTVSDNPVAQIIAMRMEGIVRSEKNRATRALFATVQKYPNPDVWEVMGKLPMREVLDNDTGMVKKVVDFGAVNEDEVIGVKISGETLYMRIKDPLMVEAVKNMSSKISEVWGPFLQNINAGTRMWARLQTGANPNFVFPNGMSDFLEGVWTAYSADKKGMMRGYVKNYPIALYYGLSTEMGDSWAGRKLTGEQKRKMKKLTGQDISDGQIAKWEKYRREWEADGGRINFMAFRDMDEITRDINRSIEGASNSLAVRIAKGGIEGALSAIEKFNQPVEMAGRLAMYVAARENGYSRERAAEMSLDTSGNYYRRGRKTRGMGAFYAFFNAAVQGIEKLVRFAKMPRNQAMIASLVAGQYFLTEFFIKMYEDDDDPEGRSLYLDIPEYERQRSIIIPTGIIEETVTNPDGTPVMVPETDENGDTVMIRNGQGEMVPKMIERKVKRLDYKSFRVPHALRPFMALGEQLAILKAGFTDPKDATHSISRSILMNNNPLGDETFMNMIAPTVLDPAVDLTQNRSWTGGPIYPEAQMWNEGLPRSHDFWERSTSDQSVWVAQTLNEMTGGDSLTPGAIDIQPGQIDHISRFFIGGLGRFAQDTTALAKDVVAGAEIEPRDVPVMKAVSNRTAHWPENDLYYNMRDDVTARRNRLRAAKKILDDPQSGPKQLADAEREYRTLMQELNVGIRKNGNFDWTKSPVKVIDRADDKLKEMREELTLVVNSETLSRAERKKRAKEIRLRMEAAQIDARKEFLDKMAKFAVE